MQVKNYSDIKNSINEKESELIQEVENTIKNVKNGTVSISVKDGEVVRIEKFENYRW